MKAVVCAALALLSACTLSAQEVPRVFITDSKSWEVRGSEGGARPQTAEVVKTFTEKCPNVKINNKEDKADYSVVLDHEGGKSWYRKDNKVAIFNWDGDSIVSKSTRSLGGSVEEACKAITADWAAHGTARTAARQTATSALQTAAKKEPDAAPVSAPATAKVNVASNPEGADIEVDGSFVGSTPSGLVLAAGEHTITVKKTGHKAWEKKMKVTGGEISLKAELEKEDPK